MQDYVALATGPDGQPFVIVGAANELQEVRAMAERYVTKHPDESVSVFNKTGTVSIVCSPKWQ